MAQKVMDMEEWCIFKYTKMGFEAMTQPPQIQKQSCKYISAARKQMDSITEISIGLVRVMVTYIILKLTDLLISTIMIMDAGILIVGTKKKIQMLDSYQIIKTRADYVFKERIQQVITNEDYKGCTHKHTYQYTKTESNDK